MNKIIITNGEMYKLAYPDILVWVKDIDDWLCCSPISSLDPSDQDEMLGVMRRLNYPMNLHSVMSDILNAFYEKHENLDSRLGLLNSCDEDQLEWLQRWSKVWDKVGQRHRRLKQKYGD